MALPVSAGAIRKLLREVAAPAPDTIFSRSAGPTGSSRVAYAGTRALGEAARLRFALAPTRQLGGAARVAP
jgi:hypothetical protein